MEICPIGPIELLLKSTSLFFFVGLMVNPVVPGPPTLTIIFSGYELLLLPAY
jgi:hypothetical protein